jgi:hypothetical protein
MPTDTDVDPDSDADSDADLEIPEGPVESCEECHAGQYYDNLEDNQECADCHHSIARGDGIPAGATMGGDG